MRLRLLAISLALTSSLAFAGDEENFQRCVQLKDMTLVIAEQADRGVSRSELKSRVSSTSAHPLIDFVYDFRGAKSNQEIAANQMENCLKSYGIRAKR